MYISQKFLEFKQMQAIILAAGLGRRLKEYTQNKGTIHLKFILQNV